MANKRHKPEEIVQKLRQFDVLVGHLLRSAGSLRKRKYGGKNTQYPSLRNRRTGGRNVSSLKLDGG